MAWQVCKLDGSVEKTLTNEEYATLTDGWEGGFIGEINYYGTTEENKDTLIGELDGQTPDELKEQVRVFKEVAE
jgi:hypothetical protein